MGVRPKRRGRRMEAAITMLRKYPDLRPQALVSARRHEREAVVREAERLLSKTGVGRIYRTEQGAEIWDTEPADPGLFTARLDAGVPLVRAVRIIGGWKE